MTPEILIIKFLNTTASTINGAHNQCTFAQPKKTSQHLFRILLLRLVLGKL